MPEITPRANGPLWGWQDDGSFEPDIQSIDAQLADIALNAKHPQAPLVGCKGDGVTDDAPTLQSLINYAQSNGYKQVFVPYGTYIIGSSIQIPYNISFEGNYSSFIPVLGNSYLRNHMFLLNDDGTDWIQSYPADHPEFRNVFVDNSTVQHTSIHGVYVASQVKIYNMRTSHTYGTITKTSKDYLDMVEINTVDITAPRGTDYHIDCGYTGDGFCVERVHSHDWEASIGNYNLIKVTGNNGGKIERIINGNIFIANSNAIRISSLHLEHGTVTIQNSSYLLENVYQWQTGVIPLTISNDPSSSNRYSRAGNISNYVVVYYATKYDSTQSLFDAQINNAVVNITGLYRGIQPVTGVVEQCDLKGVRITTDGTTEHVFNNNSARNSIRSTILYDRMSQNVFTQVMPSSMDFLYSTLEDDSKENGVIPIGSYYYRCQLIIDKTRLIGKYDQYEKSVTTQYANGTVSLIAFGVDYQVENFWRIFKGTSSSSYNQSVDLPIVSGEIHWDDGNGIAGFPWVSRTAGSWGTINSQFTQVTYKGNNVECFGTSIPTVGTWTTGDRIINSAPATGSPKAWVCTAGGTPGTWVSEGNL